VLIGFDARSITFACLLDAYRFNSANAARFDPSFKEGEPAYTVLSGDGLEEAWHVRLCRRERLGSAPFGEALNDPVGHVLGGVYLLEPFAKGRHEQSPNEEDCWFLAGPHWRAFSCSPQRGQSEVGCSFHFTNMEPTAQKPEVCFDTHRRRPRGRRLRAAAQTSQSIRRV
jgi:hypothetical protein